MRRRDLLAGASALFVMLPLSAFAFKATCPEDFPIADLRLLEGALDVAAEFEFALPKRVALFGFDSSTVRDSRHLHDLVRDHAFKYTDVADWDRVRFLLAMKEEVERRVGRNNVSAQLRWVKEPNKLFCGRSLHELMSSGNLLDLRHAARAFGLEIV